MSQRCQERTRHILYVLQPEKTAHGTGRQTPDEVYFNNLPTLSQTASATIAGYTYKDGTSVQSTEATSPCGSPPRPGARQWMSYWGSGRVDPSLAPEVSACCAPDGVLSAVRCAGCRGAAHTCLHRSSRTKAVCSCLQDNARWRRLAICSSEQPWPQCVRTYCHSQRSKGLRGRRA